MRETSRIIPVVISLIVFAFFSAGFTTGSSVYLNGNDADPLTGQIWAVQVEANPGESGTLSQNFEAAYGPYDSSVIEGGTVKKDAFGFKYDDDGYLEVVKGPEYVGNYFHIEQEAGTTGGTTRRYIDISSPWSGGYLYEDMTVVGIAYIQDIFNMDNLKPGAEAVSNWYDLF